MEKYVMHEFVCQTAPPLTFIEDDAMGRYEPPAYKREEVNRAGKRLTGDTSIAMDKDTAFAVVHSWRLGHNKPLNAMYMSAKRRAPKVGKSAIIAQRLKRLESIVAKLSRGEVEKLTQIQDIGGCRVVFQTVANVRAFAEIRSSDSKTFSFHGNPKDYITNPKPTGYRSYHLVYHYISDTPSYNGLKIELQVRTKLQHMWATAVETVSTFNRLPLKSGGIDANSDWSRFFVLASGAFAAWEKTPRVPDTPDNYAVLKKELSALTQKLNVTNVLNAWRTALNILPAEKVTKTIAYMLTLDVASKTFSYRALKESELPSAEAQRLETEKTTGKDVVIVRVGSMAYLKKAYPNYFADTADFIMALGSIVRRD
jgi:hypothetical protein